MASNEKYKIVIVDDDKFLIDMYSLKFHKEGIEVVSIESGDVLLQRIQDGIEVDLILLDIIVPGTDGLAVLAKIREGKMLPGVKIVMLTNNGDPEEVAKAKKLGIDDYIIKATATPSEVVEKVKKILNS